MTTAVNNNYEITINIPVTSNASTRRYRACSENRCERRSVRWQSAKHVELATRGLGVPSVPAPIADSNMDIISSSLLSDQSSHRLCVLLRQISYLFRPWISF